MNRVLISLGALLAASIIMVACGTNYNNNTNQVGPTSGLSFRAFVSNPLQATGTGGSVPVLNIVNAQTDVLTFNFVQFSSVLTTTVSNPGLMVVSPDRKLTLVYSETGNTVAVVNNKTEAVLSSGSTALAAVSLPGFTESMVASNFSTSGYAAVPNAPVNGQQPGALVAFSLSSSSITAALPIPSVHYVVQSPNGNQLMAFSDNSDTITLIVPSLIGSSTDPRTPVCCFDRPVWGIYTSDTTALIFSCGLPCGGTAASISSVDLGTNTITNTVAVPAATFGLLSGGTLYVAGTPPGTACTSGTAAALCGTLSLVDLGSFTVTSQAEITNGYHNRIEMGANGQLFVGAKNCTNLNISGGEVRGCLSIYSTSDGSVVVPPDNGDVTGIAPVARRSVVYVCENGELRMYDTTTDKLQTTQVNIIGQAVDVKIVDP